MYNGCLDKWQCYSNKLTPQNLVIPGHLATLVLKQIERQCTKVHGVSVHSAIPVGGARSQGRYAGQGLHAWLLQKHMSHFAACRGR
jgi:hypothetical protein